METFPAFRGSSDSKDSGAGSRSTSSSEQSDEGGKAIIGMKKKFHLF